MQDRMVWIGTEGGRECYALQTYRLCCKWFAPRNRRDDSDVHARAFAASSTCASLPVAPHVPVAHTSQDSRRKETKESGWMLTTF